MGNGSDGGRKQVYSWLILDLHLCSLIAAGGLIGWVNFFAVVCRAMMYFFTPHCDTTVIAK